MTLLVFYSKMSVYPNKICHLQLNSRQIILFRLKSHHFRTYFLYMIGYNNVSPPVHDPLHDPLRFHDSPARNLGVVIPPTPRIDAYGLFCLSIREEYYAQPYSVNISVYPDSYFFGTQSLTCVIMSNRTKKISVPPTRSTGEFSHRLVYYRNIVYEFGHHGINTYTVPDWTTAKKCPVTWELAPADISRCSKESLTAFVDGYIKKHGKYHMRDNNSHTFANRLSDFLFLTNCGRYN